MPFRYSFHVAREAEDNLVDWVECGSRIAWRLPHFALLDPAAADARRPELVVVSGTALFVVDGVTVRTLYTDGTRRAKHR
jgi:hypothetical protein